MVLPIVAYGDPVLKRKADAVDPEYPGLKQFIADMFDTMTNAKGVGIAAPQVGKSIRIFVVDASPFADDEENTEEEREQMLDFKKVFINAEILDEEGEEWSFNEGCLSIPTIREDVYRKPVIRIRYFDENFKQHEEEYDGIIARIIQHEYDHIEGKLFTDKINPLRKRLLKRRLTDISKGSVKVDYKMRFPVKK
jgi:peptide deformylase